MEQQVVKYDVTDAAIAEMSEMYLPLTIEDLEEIWAETSRGIQTESDFSNDANLLAALEADVKLRWAPGALDAGRGSNHRGKKHAG